MQEGLADLRMRDPPVEVLVPVPLHRARLRERGFNQAAVVAEELGRRAGIEVCDVLERVRETGSQARLGRSQRLGNLRAAFRLRNARDARGAGGCGRIAGRHVVLVDDVLATGGTLKAVMNLCQKNHFEVKAMSLLINLTFLNKFTEEGHPVHSVINY
jgi:ComF family protein